MRVLVGDRVMYSVPALFPGGRAPCGREGVPVFRKEQDRAGPWDPG